MFSGKKQKRISYKVGHELPFTTHTTRNVAGSHALPAEIKNFFCVSQWAEATLPLALMRECTRSGKATLEETQEFVAAMKKSKYMLYINDRTDDLWGLVPESITLAGRIRFKKVLISGVSESSIAPYSGYYVISAGNRVARALFWRDGLPYAGNAGNVVCFSTHYGHALIDYMHDAYISALYYVKCTLANRWAIARETPHILGENSGGSRMLGVFKNIRAGVMMGFRTDNQNADLLETMPPKIVFPIGFRPNSLEHRPRIESTLFTFDVSLLPLLLFVLYERSGISLGSKNCINLPIELTKLVASYVAHL